MKVREDEARIVQAFKRWLEDDGWKVEAELAFVDLVAERGGDRVFVEAKGRTTAPGLDIDTLYGQLLRRMPEEEIGTARFFVVVPQSAVQLALRVPARVRQVLRIEVFGVDEDGQVHEVPDR